MYDQTEGDIHIEFRYFQIEKMCTRSSRCSPAEVGCVLARWGDGAAMYVLPGEGTLNSIAIVRTERRAVGNASTPFRNALRRGTIRRNFNIESTMNFRDDYSMEKLPVSAYYDY